MATGPQTPSTGDYFGEWLTHVKGRVRHRTWKGYEGLIRLYAAPTLGDHRLDEVTSLDVQRLYGELLSRTPPLSGGTVLNLHLVLTQAFGQAVRWQYLSTSPVAGAQPPRPRRKEMPTIDVDATTRILSEIEGTRFETPVAIAIATGMRRGEILGLRWSDVDRNLTSARVRRSLQTGGGLRFEDPKTRRSRRTVALPDFLSRYLVRERDRQAMLRRGPGWTDHGLVVTNTDGSPMHPDTLSSGWSSFCRRRGLPHIRFHDLRHAHATLMLLQGVHPKVVSERLGHASIGITLDTYSHVLPAMQEEAVRAFDALFP